MKSLQKVLAMMLCAVVMTGCASTQNAKKEKNKQSTASVVKRQIHDGMTSAEVEEALGAPTSVTKHPDGTVTWVYEGITSKYELRESKSGEYIVLQKGKLVVKPGTGESPVLTVIIHFDKEHKVSYFSYRGPLNTYVQW